MRVTILFLIVAFIMTPVVSIATESSNIETWENARYKQNSGTVGGISVSLSEDTLVGNKSMNIEDFPTIIETYTATWCENCVIAEQKRDEAIGNNTAAVIHYHRHYYETQDPFGDNSTENRWELIYGASSTNILGASRLAPTTVIDGERMHPGHRPKTNSLENDFASSIAVGSTAPLYGNISLSVTKNDANGDNRQSSMFSWATSTLTSNCADDCPNTVTTTAWLLFVEDVAYFPEGSNDLEYYHHVLHHVILLDELDGSMNYSYPSAWDDDDMNVILIVDWVKETSSDNFFPGPSMILTIFCLLISSLVYSKKN